MSLTQPKPLPRTETRNGPDGAVFPWGPIDAIHQVGPYQIVEYRRDASTFRQESVWDSHGVTMFSVYIEGKGTSMSYHSLDSALVGAVAYRRCGPNAQAAAYFDLMTLGEIPDGAQ